MAARLPVVTRVLLQAPAVLLAGAALAGGILEWERGAAGTSAAGGDGARGDGTVAMGDRRVELVRGSGGELRCYVLGADGVRLQPLPAAELPAEVLPDGAEGAARIRLRAEAQPGDPPGSASAFVGPLPPGLAGTPLRVALTVPLEGRSYRLRFALHPAGADPAPVVLPSPAGGEAQRRLYATPGGRYTADDIRTNGAAPAGERFGGQMASHHLHPRPGERVCPITRTRANPRFAWVIGGRRYLFCCPPCIDEFLKEAKMHPETVRSPESYVQR